jgi:hypothetical protein
MGHADILTSAATVTCHAGSGSVEPARSRRMLHRFGIAIAASQSNAVKQGVEADEKEKENQANSPTPPLKQRGAGEGQREGGRERR